MNSDCFVFFMKKSLLALATTVLFTMTVQAQSIGGSSVDTNIPEVEAAALLQENNSSAEPVPSARIAPFGASMFQGGFSNDSEDGINPTYIIKPGDSISVRIWGATQFNDRLVVDPQGNIFIPMVGPIAVAGTPNGQLNDTVSTAVGRVFTDNVRVYTSLDGTQPVAVFVTGFVPNPGRFAGIPSNSAMYYLDRAGGIDAERGSYRNIVIKRRGDVVANLDLYDFLITGNMPSVQFEDGDTIVVGARGKVITATGDIANSAAFEFSTDFISGQELLDLAFLDVDVNYAGVSGFRDRLPFSKYITIDEFRAMRLDSGDTVNFQADQHDNVIVVDIEGPHMGPSRYSVPKGTRLNELLDYIEIDREAANIGAISLKRKAIAVRQKEALEESLRRLESAYLTAASHTDAESAIRAQEAQLIGRFVQRARDITPSGRLVVASTGGIANVALQQGDTISIPQVSDSILLGGEVLVSQAMLFVDGNRAMDYIESSGGFTPQALTDRIILLHANGEVSSSKNPIVNRGDEIIVLPKVPVKNLQVAATIVDIVYKVAIAASVALSL